MRAPAVHVGPAAAAAAAAGVAAAVVAAGGVVAPLEGADAVVWLSGDPATLPSLPASVRWVQLPGAGVDRWLTRIAKHPETVFTSAVGVYGHEVAEHALALLLASTRGIAAAVRATTWTAPAPVALEGATVAVIGAGAIGEALIGLLAPHGVTVLAVTRSGRSVSGAARSLPVTAVDEVWPVADHVVLAAPATAATRHLVGAPQLRALKPAAHLVNVARGSLVDTDALVAALRAGELAGAALDVTDPEPLPDGHPLWTEPRALLTPHIATRGAPFSPHFATRVRANLTHLIAGTPLLHTINPTRGY